MSFALETQIHKSLDFYLKINGLVYKPVQIEPYELKVGDFVFTRLPTLSFALVCKIKRLESGGTDIIGESIRVNTEYNFRWVDILCAFRHVKVFGVFRVRVASADELIFSSCDFAKCCHYQEEKQKATRTGIETFYVASII